MPPEDTAHRLEDVLGVGPIARAWADLGLGERYTPIAQLGRGAFGEVWRARDGHLGYDVAIKLVEIAPADSRRVVREVAALRHAELPGVVRLLASGSEGPWAWMSMTLVEGLPFPGVPTPIPWAALAPRVEGLLTVLGCVHGAGLVHRDLKPNNVLVDADGAPTILDFGLARGAAGGSTITRSGALLGTPRYMAPEQCRGRRADARSDLYAVGVMIFEALTGEPPQGGADLREVLRRRLSTPAPPIRSRVPDLPLRVAAGVDALLALEPFRRPPTAEAARRLFRGEGQRTGELPLLDREDACASALTAIRAFQAVRVGGAPGSGRTRLIEAVTSTLASDGWRVLSTRDGSRPFESLLSLFPGEDVDASVRRGMAELAGTSTLLVVDGLGGLDRWSRGLLKEAQGRVAWMASVEAGAEAEIRLSPIPAAALEGLFAGPERLFHLRSDAAALLWRRTAGLPGAVVVELDGWTSRGLATWEEGRLRVTRPELERIEAGAIPPAGMAVPAGGDEDLNEVLLWIQLAGNSADVELLSRARAEPTWALDLQVRGLEDAGAVRRDATGLLVPLVPRRYGDDASDELLHAIHGALADALPIGSPARLTHLLAAGRTKEAGVEAPAAAGELLRDGRAAAAVGLLEEAILAGDVSSSDLDAPALGAMLVRAAWADRTGDVLRRARYVASRMGANEPWTAILDASPAVRPGGATLAALPPHPDPQVDVIRRGMVVLVASSQGALAWSAALLDAEAWAKGTGLAEVEALALRWRADFHYARAEFGAAAELALRAARLAPAVGDRLGYLFRAAAVYLEEGEVAQVLALGEEIREAAALRRLSLHEARGEWLLRVVAERTGAAQEVDEELVEAAARLGDGGVAGLLMLTEARVAWRTGRHGRGAALADLSVSAFEAVAQGAGALCGRALHIACGGAGSPIELLAEAERLDRPDVSVEVIGLLASADRLPPGDWAAQLAAAAARLPGYRRDWPHGAMSVNGALALLRPGS